ncbi:phage/plasmid primase, P4 family [Amycolatopsis sp. NPDC088138]|uniref:DNA primase family protein n=1 Tax=Amycolatopsis sp. NPDC088138 TaxID=3363938 RepID=UPI00380CF1D6
MIHEWPAFDELSNWDAPPPVEEEGLVAEWVAERAFVGRYVHARGLGWLMWDSRRWAQITAVTPQEHLRQFAIEMKCVAGVRVADLLETDEYQRLDDLWSRFLEAEGGADASVEQIERLKQRFYGLSEEGARLRELDRVRDVWVAVEHLGSKLLKLGRLTAILRFVAEIEGVFADGAEFDQDREWLCCLNGVVDLCTGELLPHDPARKITKLAPTAYRPKYTDPLWTQALRAVAPDAIAWLQTFVGQAVTGYVGEQLLVSVGDGSNGKSLVMGALASALGDYHTTVHHKALQANKGDHATEMMEWRGARLAVLEELPEGRHLHPNIFKQLVDSPSLKARAMRQDPLTFTLTHTLLINTNFLPQIAEPGHGAWRRLAALPWPHTFRPRGVALGGPTDLRGDPTLKRRLASEPGAREAVLAWVVEGAVNWFAQEGLPETPESVIALTTKWRNDEDHVGRFIEENLVIEEGCAVRITELFEGFRTFLGDAGKSAWSADLFARRLEASPALRAAGVQRKAIKHGTSWTVTTLGGVTVPASNKTVRAWVGLRWRRENEPHLSVVHSPDEDRREVR